MPQGLQVWDAGGVLVIDTTTRVGRLIDVITITGANMSGSDTNDQLLTGDPWFFLTGDHEDQPTVSFSGNDIT